MIKRSSSFTARAVLVSAVMASRAANGNQGGLDLPQPNGSHEQGTRTVVLRDPHRSRDLLVTTWYPSAADESQPVPYMDEKTANALAEEWKLQPNFQR